MNTHAPNVVVVVEVVGVHVGMHGCVFELNRCDRARGSRSIGDEDKKVKNGC